MTRKFTENEVIASYIDVARFALDDALKAGRKARMNATKEGVADGIALEAIKIELAQIAKRIATRHTGE